MYTQMHFTLALSIAWSLTLTPVPCQGSSFTSQPQAAFLSPLRQPQSRSSNSGVIGHTSWRRDHLNTRTRTKKRTNKSITTSATGPLHLQSQFDESTTTIVMQETATNANTQTQQSTSSTSTTATTPTSIPKDTQQQVPPQDPPKPGPEPPPPHAAQTLDGRLLCASQCAYKTAPPYFRSSSYRPTTIAKRITRGVNSALIGHTTDGITIAFRGTQTTSLLDWLQNAALFLSDVDEKYNKYSIKGKIHTGFYRGTKSLWKPLKGILKEMLEVAEENGWSQNVYLTGHSKGGAMASIAAVLLKRDSILPDPTYVCTFASARVGNSEFRDAYNQRINQTSYEAHLDLIPFLPPSATTMETMSDEMSEMIEGVLWSEASFSKKQNYKWDYQTLGDRKYIDEEGDIITDVTRELDKERIREIEKTGILSLDEFKQAHCSGCASEGCGGTYFSAIAEDTCEVICEKGEGPDGDEE